MSLKSSPNSHLAEHSIHTWMDTVSSGDQVPASRPLPGVGKEIKFIRKYQSEGGSSCRLAVFCIDRKVVLLSVSGHIREQDAKELISMFRESNPFKGDHKPMVILDFSQTEHVAYQARKRILLAIHILRTKSQKVWFIESQEMKALMDMHHKMYPNTDHALIYTRTLLTAFQESLRAEEDSATANPMDKLPPSRGGSVSQPTETSSALQFEQLRAILNSAPDPIFFLTPEGYFSDTNDAGQEFFKDVLKSSFEKNEHLMRVWPLTTEENWPQLLSDLHHGHSWSRQMDIPGEKIHQYFQINLSPVPGTDSEISGISIFVRDITQTKLVEKQARYHKELIDSISYSIQEGLFRSSPQEGIMFVNQAFVEMFGYDSVEEVLELDPYELYVDTSRRDDFVRIVKDQSSFINEEVHFRRKDGSTFWGLISSVKKVENDMVYHDGAIRDVTPLRETQHRLKEKNQELTTTNEELHKVNKELDAFVYRVSHDLRAPLVSMLGLISISRLEEDPKKRQRYMELMEKSIKRLDDFILDIMNYSRNTRTDLRSDEVALGSMIDHLVEDLRYSQQGNITITSDVPQDLKIRTDSQRLQPILNNLLSNSIRYMDPEKEKQWVNISARPHKEGVLLTVQDNGIGIEEEHQKKIFKMFYRASRHSEGSGIGLYIVQETVDKLHGTIELESAKGVGTTFRIYLPDSPERLEPEA